MADENPTAKAVIEWHLLGRQMSDVRLRLGQLEGRVNDIGRDVKLLLVMAQNQDEAFKDFRQEMREMVSAVNTRVVGLEQEG